MTVLCGKTAGHKAGSIADQNPHTPIDHGLTHHYWTNQARTMVIGPCCKLSEVTTVISMLLSGIAQQNGPFYVMQTDHMKKLGPTQYWQND